MGCETVMVVRRFLVITTSLSSSAILVHLHLCCLIYKPQVIPEFLFNNLCQASPISFNLSKKNSHQKLAKLGGWPRGRVVKFARSAAGSPVFRWFESCARTWHCSSNHAKAASHMPQLKKDPQRRIYNYVPGGFGEKKEKIKSLKIK